jgi:catechol 2,3-dioxygenase-like lactoylglutathione lyase family enzyme
MTGNGIGLRRLQHLVLFVSDVERSVRFYTDVLGFEVKVRYPNAAFLKIPGTPDDHHLGLFEQRGVPPPDERVARMYHSAWEVGELTDLARARQRLMGSGRSSASRITA